MFDNAFALENSLIDLNTFKMFLDPDDDDDAK